MTFFGRESPLFLVTQHGFQHYQPLLNVNDSPVEMKVTVPEASKGGKRHKRFRTTYLESWLRKLKKFSNVALRWKTLETPGLDKRSSAYSRCVFYMHMLHLNLSF